MKACITVLAVITVAAMGVSIEALWFPGIIGSLTAVCILAFIANGITKKEKI